MVSGEVLVFEAVFAAVRDDIFDKEVSTSIPSDDTVGERHMLR